MLKRFSLRNYKNFKDDISIDFDNIAGYQFSDDCITNGMISKMLIYGRNATGKTNLGRALMDIVYIVYGGLWRMDKGTFLNADSSEDVAVFSYTFQFDEYEVIYRYTRLANRDLRDEELIIEQKTIYQCDFQHGRYNFDNLQYVGAEIVSIERYMQSLLHDEEGTGETTEYQLPFFRWLISNVALKSDSMLLKLSDYVKRMNMVTVSQGIMRRPRQINDAFFESFEDLSALGEFEEFLNVMGIKCKLALRKLPDGQRELYFAYEKLVPFFENASSGTLALVELYRRFVVAGRGASLLYLDEFDAFYHYEMAENIIKFFKKNYPKCQIIMTTHNTNLMTNR
ncbi:MAG: ATP-binding protein, partial [Lachnospiraceae bacterium]|nr:ATP-binding protein [Lachnospiraceae bacterium]